MWVSCGFENCVIFKSLNVSKSLGATLVKNNVNIRKYQYIFKGKSIFTQMLRIINCE